MDRTTFIKEILNTECAKCPINGYCEDTPAHNCMQTAKSFYDHILRNKGGAEYWQYIKDLHLHQKPITPNL